jgi:hypothetical protein
MTATTELPTESLLELMEQLVASIELREAGGPGTPAAEAEGRIARLEAELARRVASGESLGAARADMSKEALAEIA